MADLDIDDELLMLAGEASEEEDEAPKTTTEKASTSPDRKPSGTSAKKSGAKAGRRGSDSEEEGEASSSHSSPTSQHSAPMDESDSESDAGPTFNNGEKYPLEGKYRNAADKAEIMAMPEVKREEVLAERAQEAEDENRHNLLRRMLEARDENNNKNEKKRKSPSDGREDDPRKTSRQRTKLGGGKVGESSTGIDSLKRARAEKVDKLRQRNEARERNKGRKDEDYSEADADGDSDVDWDTGRLKTKKSKSPDYRDAEPADLRDLERIRIGRSHFAKVCFYPGFEHAITGCKARICVGPDAKGENVYRMTTIKSFVEGKPYAIENPVTKKAFVTTQYLRVAHGKSERNWPFIVASDSPFTESEMAREKQTCLVDGVPVFTKPKVNAKIADINNLLNRTWTEAELQEKLTKSGVLVNKYNPIERNRINNLIKEAKSAGNHEKVATLEKELVDLDGQKLAWGTSMQAVQKKVFAKGLSQQERLAQLNADNKRKNIEEIRHAQIAERRAAKMTEAALARGENVPEDHSRRVKTRAIFKHDVNKGTEVKTPTPSAAASGNATPEKKVLSPEQLHLARLQKERSETSMGTGFGRIRKPLQHDDIVGSIDLGIDLEL